jgi:large subunit ribosomal protein L18
LSVFRSGKHVLAQLVDDDAGQTIAAASDRESEAGSRKPEVPTLRPGSRYAVVGTESRKVASAYAVGKLLAERAKAKGIVSAVFDRGGYAYHGRVRAIAEGAREGGLQF